MFPFKTALNASTLFPFQLDVLQQVEVAAQAGYAGIELWVKDIEAYLAAGGTTQALRERIEQSGLTLVNAIAFFAWADADPAKRAQALLQAEREMKILQELGCQGVAAPPFGDVAAVSLQEMAEAFALLSQRAQAIGIRPYLEFWGRAPKLSSLGEALFVAAQSGLEDVKLLLDPFHMYTGGSKVEAISLMRGSTIGVVHVNDYPAEPARATIADSDRVFPGQGIAPSQQIARLLHSIGYDGFLSLELFISDFGSESALDVAKRGLETIRSTYTV
jgi:Sugar phosphate isomerases/epimerases